MPSQHKTPLLGWHPASAELAAWVRAEAERRGVPVARVLDEALEAYRKATELAGSEGGCMGWQPGDRVKLRLPDKSRAVGLGYADVLFYGTVREVDPPGLPS
jgi:hypothetical protein